jgi:hypothetical protein
MSNKSGIHIKPSKKGTFTAAAKKHGKSVQGFASQVLANKENYSPAMVKKANFARNAAKWKHKEGGGEIPMAMYGSDIEPFVYNGYTDNTPIVRSNWHDPKKRLTAQAGKNNLPPLASTVGKRNALGQWNPMLPVPQWEYNEATDAPLDVPTSVMPPEQLSPAQTMQQTGLGPTPKRQQFEQDIQKTYDTNYFAKNKYDRSLEKPAKQKDGINPVYAGIAALSFLSNTFQGSQPRNYYKPEDEPYYNPFPQGLGSQAIAEHGGWIDGSNAVEFPYKSGIKFKVGGEMIKRAYGSYSRRGLWDNIRANKGSGKKPTAEMLKQERKIKAEEAAAGMDLTNLYYPQNGEIMNVGSPNFGIARTGDNIRINYGGDMETGGELSLYDDTTGVQPVSDNPYSAPIVKFLGPDHGEKNNIGSEGVPINYEGTPVEVYGGEHATIDSKGNMQIFGDMKNPLTNNKKTFNQTAKEIAKQENKANKKLNKGLDLVNNANLNSPYDMLSFNSGRLKMKGAESELKSLSDLKELTASIQSEKLRMAEALGIEPMDMDKKAKYGKMVKAQSGEGDVGEQTFAGYAPIQGTSWYEQVAPETMVRNTAPKRAQLIPDSSPVVAKPSALKPVPAPAITSRPYTPAAAPAPAPASVKSTTTPARVPATTTTTNKSGKKGSTNDRQVVSMDRTPVDVVPETTPQTTPVAGNVKTEDKVGRKTDQVQQQQQNTSSNNQVVYYPGVNNLESDAEGLDWRNIAGEVYTAITEQPEPVYMQKYRPELMQPYEVSFQDRINRNNTALRAANQAIGNNPSAQAALAAQNYAANQDVAAEEFRYNQGISANVYNQNRAIMNETQKLNLGLAAEQAHKQALARANTRRNRLDALQSFASKDLMHDAAMNRLRTLENLYDYRFDPKFMAQYAGEDTFFNMPNAYGYNPFSPAARSNKNSSVTTTTTRTTPSGQKVVRKETEEQKNKKFGGSIVRAFKNYKY